MAQCQDYSGKCNAEAVNTCAACGSEVCSTHTYWGVDKQAYCRSCDLPSQKGKVRTIGASMLAILLFVVVLLGLGQNVAQAQISTPTIDAPNAFAQGQNVTVTFNVPPNATSAYLAVSAVIKEYPSGCTLVVHQFGVNCTGTGDFTIGFEVQYDATEVWLFNRVFYLGGQDQVEIYVPAYPLPCVLDPMLCTDLKVELKVEPTEIKAGQTVTATVAITNNGSASQVSTSLNMPDGPVVNRVDDFAAGETKIYTVSTQLANSFTFTATAVADRPELRPADNKDFAIVTVIEEFPVIWLQIFLPTVGGGVRPPDGG